jgi:hypothetical protein
MFRPTTPHSTGNRGIGMSLIDHVEAKPLIATPRSSLES